MEFIPDIHIQEILKNVFTFFGTLSEEGYVLSFDGKIFDKIDTDPQLLSNMRRKKNRLSKSNANLTAKS